MTPDPTASTPADGDVILCEICQTPIPDSDPGCDDEHGMLAHAACYARAMEPDLPPATIRERVELPCGLHAERPLRRGDLHDVYEADEHSSTGRYHCGRLTRSAVDKLAALLMEPAHAVR